MSTTIFEGFSVSHAAILDGSTGAEVADIYGVRSATLELDTDDFENTGDDYVLSTWTWFNSATLSVTSGYIPFAVVALLSGSTVTSSGTAPADTYSMPLWNEKSLNQSRRPVLIRVPSKDSNGVARELDIVLYNVQFAPISFDGPTYKDGLVLNYTGKALISSVDETGDALSERAFGRLINRPQS